MGGVRPVYVVVLAYLASLETQMMQAPSPFWASPVLLASSLR